MINDLLDLTRIEQGRVNSSSARRRRHLVDEAVRGFSRRPRPGLTPSAKLDSATSRSWSIAIESNTCSTT